MQNSPGCYNGLELIFAPSVAKTSLNNMQLLRNQFDLVCFVMIYVSITENITRRVKGSRAENAMFLYKVEHWQ